MSDDVFLDFGYDRNSEDIIERKVGDIFDIKGIKYIVVKGSCNVCSFDYKLCTSPELGNCFSIERSDSTQVSFQYIK